MTRISKKRPLSAPISLRLSDDERKHLENSARSARLPTISAYIRMKLFAAENQPLSTEPATQRFSAFERQKLLALILGRLGELALLRNLTDLAEAARLGVLPVTPEVAQDIQAACAAVLDLRNLLLKGLGLKPPSDADHDS